MSQAVGRTEWKPRILLAEDDEGMRAVMRFNLEEEDYAVTEVGRGSDALARLPARPSDDPTQEPPFDLVVTDLKMPGADGMAVLRAAKACHPDIEVVMVTAFGTVEHAIEALGEGAIDYITKPFKRAEFKARIAAVVTRMALERENLALRARVEGVKGPSILTDSPRMQEILRVAERVAASDATVLLSGESGTGKELVARLIHARSGRSERPFVPVNCAALPHALLESELFGHERGAFTGAERTHRGKFEQAHQGTLFLDEIGELPVDLQSKLLRVIEDGVVDRVGGTGQIQVDARVVVATNKDLEEEVRERRFREDLFHRLSVIPIRLPPLRERAEDVPLLVRLFLGELGLADQVVVAPALMQELAGRPWPGNVRELKNVTERMALLRRADVLDLADLAPPGTVLGPATGRAEAAPATKAAARLRPGELVLPDAPFELPALEREIVLKALEKHGGNQSATARYLGIPRHVLIYRLEKYQSGKV